MLTFTYTAPGSGIAGGRRRRQRAFPMVATERVPPAQPRYTTGYPDRVTPSRGQMVVNDLTLGPGGRSRRSSTVRVGEPLR